MCVRPTQPPPHRAIGRSRSFCATRRRRRRSGTRRRSGAQVASYYLETKGLKAPPHFQEAETTSVLSTRGVNTDVLNLHPPRHGAAPVVAELPLGQGEVRITDHYASLHVHALRVFNSIDEGRIKNKGEHHQETAT